MHRIAAVVLLFACDGRASDVETDDEEPLDTAPIAEDEFTSVGAGGIFESEVHVAADPGGTHVAIAWISVDMTGNSIGYSLSHDGGTTWSAPALLTDPEGRRATDPVVGVDSEGRVFLSWIAYRLDMTGTPSDMHLNVSRTEPGGDAFTTVDTLGARDELDKPWLVVDAEDRVIVGVREELDAVIVRSADHGASWSDDLLASEAPWITLCADPLGGPVFATYVDDTWTDVFVAASDDGGAIWSDGAQIATAFTPPLPQCGAHGDSVWVTYATGAFEALDGVWLTRSDDGGAAWTEPVLVQDPDAGELVHVPQIAVAQNGRAELLYLQAAAVGEPTQVVRATTTDGEAFAYELIDDDAGPFSYRRDTLPWYGDYVGVAAGRELVWLVYPEAIEAESWATHLQLARRRPY